MDASRHSQLESVTQTVPVLTAAGQRPGAGARLVVAGWAIALCGLVGMAAIGRLAAPAPELRSAVIAFALPVESAVPVESSPPARAASVVAGPEILVLSSPAEANMTITTRELMVQGFLRAGTGRVQVTLEARGNRVIDAATVKPRLDYWQPPGVDRLARFEVRFGLPNPRPNGRMIVQVAAYDTAGNLLDVVRRRIQVGPLLDP